MEKRTTRALLAVAGLLLVVNLLRPVPLPLSLPAASGAANGEEAGNVPEVLRARRLELVDERGQVRANLQVEPSGEVVFRLRDAKGTIRVKLGTSEDGSGLLLLDDRTEPAVHLSAGKKGTTLTLAEKDKEKRVLTP